MEDLGEAIHNAQQAVEVAPQDHPDLARYLDSSMLALRFERTRRIENLEEAIRKAQQAVGVAPQDDPDLAGRLNNLSNMSAGRLGRTGRIEDLGSYSQSIAGGGSHVSRP